MAGWQPLNNQPPFNAETMLLLTDGSVMCHQELSANWHRLIPDGSGSYVAGAWMQTTPMPPTTSSIPPLTAIPTAQGGPAYAPLFFASAVLKDGRLFVAGGEYNVSQSTQVEVVAAVIYNPLNDPLLGIANQPWTYVAPPLTPGKLGWIKVGDAPCCVLPNGNVLLGNVGSKQVAIFNPVDNSWADAQPKLIKACKSAEETWTLLPDGTVLTVDCANPTNPFNAEKYVASAGGWINAGSVPVPLAQPCPGLTPEIGPAILLPDGRVFAIGATGNTCLYTPTAKPKDVGGTWAAGPTLSDSNNILFYPMDAPACLLPNGKVLCCGGFGPPCSILNPTPPFLVIFTEFFEFDPVSNTVTQVAGPSTANVYCYNCRMLLLPTGQVLLSTTGKDIQVYTPDGVPDPAWKPHITAIPSNVLQGRAQVLKGRQLNGLSQACSYGDDASMATNYPLVQVRYSAAGNIGYARTANHSTMAVATKSAIESTEFTVPAGVLTAAKSATAEVRVIANGIASDPAKVTIWYSVRTNLLNDANPETVILPLNGRGLTSLKSLIPLSIALQPGPLSLRTMMSALDETWRIAPWWQPTALELTP